MRAVDVLVGDVVHRNGDSKHILIIISQKSEMYTLVAEKPHFFGAYSFKAMLTWQYNDYSQ